MPFAYWIAPCYIPILLSSAISPALSPYMLSTYAIGLGAARYWHSVHWRACSAVCSPEIAQGTEGGSVSVCD
eukprot:450379-Rhodomonas_salina.1